MPRLALRLSTSLAFFAALAPVKAMDLCAALDADEETRTQISGVVDDVGTAADDPYLFVVNHEGKCEMLVAASDVRMIEACKKGMKVTAIGVLRWDEEAMFVGDFYQNLLDEASVVCE